MRKAISLIAIVLGVALLVFAIALPTYVVPKGKILPLDVVSTTKTETVDANLLDSGALAADRPVGDNKNRKECKGDDKQVSCFIWHNLPIQTQQFTTAQEPSDKDQVTLEAGQSVFRKDRQEPRNLVSASIDRVTLDRKTQMPVPEPVSTLNLVPPLNGNEGAGETPPEFTRPGIQYQFPMGTDRGSYPYFDKQILEANPIEFVDETETEGEKVYNFRQTIEPTSMYEPQRDYFESDGDLSKAEEGQLNALKLTFPAKVWGLKDKEIKHPKGDKDSGKGPDVEMKRYYTVDRKISVQPDTGVIVKGGEEIWMFYAQDDQEAQEIAKPENREKEIANPTRTAMYLPAEWDKESQHNQMATAKEGLSSIKTMGTVLPWVLGIVGVLLIIVGFVLHRGNRRKNNDYSYKHAQE